MKRESSFHPLAESHPRDSTPPDIFASLGPSHPRLPRGSVEVNRLLPRARPAVANQTCLSAASRCPSGSAAH